MPMISLVLQEPAWPDLAGRHDVIKLMGESAAPIGITGLEHGMVSGAPSVAFRLDLPDGRTVLAETSLALFLVAADALKERYGDPRT